MITGDITNPLTRRLPKTLTASLFGTVSSAALALLANETDGLALDFTDSYYASTGFYGSAAIKDTTTPANNYDNAPTLTASSLLTYTSPSNKLVMGPTGTLRYPAHNVLTFSEQFDNAAWAKTSATISANSIAAPDGTTTADTLLEVAATARHNVQQLGGTTVVGATYTFRVWVKGLNRTRASLVIGNALLSQGIYAVYDLSGNQIGVNPTGFGGYPATGSSASITSAAQGYSLISLTFVANDTATHFTIQADSGSGTSALSDTYLGNASNGIYLWGAHVRRTPSDSTYLATTSAARYALPIEFSSGSPVGLLVEEARTNSLLYSNDPTQTGAGLWDLSANITVALDTGITAPDGTTNTFKITGNSTSGVYRAQGVSVPSAATWTYSCYVKKGTSDFCYFSLLSGAERGLWFNFNTGLTGTTTGGVTALPVLALPNGWYRIAFSNSFGGSASPEIALPVPASADGSNTYVSGQYLYAYGAQFELGSFPTSYIQTFASTVTRAADNIRLTKENIPFSEVNGGWFAQVIAPRVSGTQGIIGANGSGHGLYFDAYRAAIFDAAQVNTSNAVSAGATAKLASTYFDTTLSAVLNGGAVATSGSAFSTPFGTSGGSTTLSIGALNETIFYGNMIIQKIMYLPRRMSNAELQTLTTP